MKLYEEFILKIVRFDSEDVIRTSDNSYEIGDDAAPDIFD